jgi:hypothetical protein
MWKPTTGEPCAGKPPARFGGRGGESLPYPYHNVEGPHFERRARLGIVMRDDLHALRGLSDARQSLRRVQIPVG